MATNIELDLFYYVTRLIKYIWNRRCSHYTSAHSLQHSFFAHDNSFKTDNLIMHDSKNERINIVSVSFFNICR